MSFHEHAVSLFRDLPRKVQARAITDYDYGDPGVRVALDAVDRLMVVDPADGTARFDAQEVERFARLAARDVEHLVVSCLPGALRVDSLVRAVALVAMESVGCESRDPNDEADEIVTPGPFWDAVVAASRQLVVDHDTISHSGVALYHLLSPASMQPASRH